MTEPCQATSDFSYLISQQAGKVCTPIPKNTRIVDEAAIEAVRAGGVCEWCKHKGKTTQSNMLLHVHHIKTKGSGGDDVPLNLILLCAHDHNEAHAKRIKPKELSELAQARETAAHP